MRITLELAVLDYGDSKTDTNFQNDCFYLVLTHRFSCEFEISNVNEFIQKFHWFKNIVHILPFQTSTFADSLLYHTT